jgi:hypothetical protein
MVLMWEVEYTNEFEEWWNSLSESEQSDVDASVGLLEEFGPNLGRPFCDTVYGSKHGNMKELRTQSSGHPLRTLFAFDPTRTAILLVGGDKKGDDRFYKKLIKLADELFSKHLRELES